MKWDNALLNKVLGNKNTADAWSADRVCTDTRSLNAGELFLAIKGKFFDAHNFLDEAYNNGAVAAIVSHAVPNFQVNMPLFFVEDSINALHKMAQEARKKLSTLIAITGSVGKTSIKDMLTFALSTAHNTYCNSGNFNNHIGLPLTLVNAPDCGAKYTILEMGMSNFGEIAMLSKLATPNIAVISNIGSAHIGNLHSKKNIALAKAEIFEHMSENATVILNRDDDFFEILKQKSLQYPNIKRIIAFGSSAKADFQLLSFDSKKVKVRALGEYVEYCLPNVGRHFAFNSVAVLAVIGALNLDIRQFFNTFAGFSPGKGRGQCSKVTLNSSKSITLIDDSYNASLESMIASLEYYANYDAHGNRKIVILGDMKELGASSVSMHLQLLPYIKPDYCVIAVGDLMHNLFKNLKHVKEKFHFNNVDDLIAQIDRLINDGDIVLVKGSNSVKLSKLISFIVD